MDQMPRVSTMSTDREMDQVPRGHVVEVDWAHRHSPHQLNDSI